jgi:pectinesterase
MRNALFIVLATIGTAHVAAAQNTQNPPFVLPDSVRMLADLAYRPGVDSLTLDLFLPKSSKNPMPGVVFVACGGWIGGAKSQLWRQAAYLAARGFPSATTQCRYAPAVRFPEQLNDAIAAVMWLRAHAANYGIDASHVAIAGASAGGHLAALVGLNQWDGVDWSSAPLNARVQAAIVFNGVLDLFDLEGAPVVTKNVTTFLGDTRSGNPALWLRASPIQHVDASAAPFLLLHGTSDATVPYRHSASMQRRLAGLGVRVDLFTAPDSGHGFFNRPPWYEPTVVAIAEFLERVFR